VPRASGFSAQTLLVLAALAADPADWRHGYDLAKQTGLKSGTLYPILIRLADRGLVEACWEEERPAGRPPRHLYRLSSAGLAHARAALADAPAAAPGAAGQRRGAAPRPTGPRPTGPRPAAPRLAGEGS
jgi:PadR family transcriptional regulator, regulatory protein PadR